MEIEKVLQQLDRLSIHLGTRGDNLGMEALSEAKICILEHKELKETLHEDALSHSLVQQILRNRSKLTEIKKIIES